MAKTYAFKNPHEKRSFNLFDPEIFEFLTPKYKKIIQAKKEKHVEPLFPIDIYPRDIQEYILAVNETLSSSIDFMGAAFLFALSIIAGNTHQIKIKNGWVDRGVVWVAIVGEAGIGKTPASDAILKPLEDLDEEFRAQYKKNLEEFQEIKQMHKDTKSKKDKAFLPDIPEEPKKLNFLTQQPTPEALAQLHQHNKVGIAILREEFSGWVLDMNKYNPGGEKQFHLSAWALKGAHAERKTTQDNDVPNPYIPVFGGIQPEIFKDMRIEGRSDKDGFIDRILLVYPSLDIEYWNEKEIPTELINDYGNYIRKMYEMMRMNIEFNSNDQVKPVTIQLSSGAKEEWKRIYNKITDIQRSDYETQYFKSMYPKQKRYIPRFALLIHLALCMFDEETERSFISKETMLKAEKLSDYFVEMAKKVKYSEKASEALETVIESTSRGDLTDKIKALHESNPNFNRTQAAKILDISRQTLITKLKELGLFEAVYKGRKRDE